MRMENLNDVMNRLTWLENSGGKTPFGDSPKEQEIKSIASLLRIFGVKWQYVLDGDRWIAVMKE